MQNCIWSAVMVAALAMAGPVAGPFGDAPTAPMKFIRDPAPLTFTAREPAVSPGPFIMGEPEPMPTGAPQKDAATLGGAVAAYDRGDYATELRLLRPLAEQGDADAQLSLGDMYGDGNGVPQDFTQATQWYRKAAEQGNVNAQFDLGILYGGPQGAPHSNVQSAQWFRKAAEQGLALAQFNLAMAYSTGIGVPKDDVLAYMWYNLAATNGDSLAAKFRDDAGTHMTPAQIAQAQRLSRNWKPTAR